MPRPARNPQSPSRENGAKSARSSEILAALHLAKEVENAPLGDKRRQERYRHILEKLIAKPDAAIPVALDQEADQEAYYRLMRNKAVDHAKLLAPHLQATRERCEGLDAVLVVHDTTEFAFDIHDEPAREDLARLSTNRQGFHWHASLALSADGLLAPMGLVASQPYVHASQLKEGAPTEEPKDAKKNAKKDAKKDAQKDVPLTPKEQQAWAFWKDQGGILDNEQSRWLTAVERADKSLKHVPRVIHVMDRESDDYCTIFPMVVAGYGFVVRVSADRMVQQGPDPSDAMPLEDHLAKLPWCAMRREVDLSARSARAASKTHPERQARTTELSLRACAASFRRPTGLPVDMAPDTIDVHVLEVREENPEEGEAPVVWYLTTDQPIDTPEDCWRVVDHYRARWMVEEYFKALKTGTAYTALQHRQARTLLAALAPKAIVAWHLLVMRHLARAMPDAPAEVVVNPVQLAILRHRRPKLIRDNPTVADVLAAVASIGGHIKNNGPAGWLVLGRGYQQLLELEQGFRLGQALAVGGEM